MRFTGFILGCLSVAVGVTAGGDATAGVQSDSTPAHYKVEWIANTIPSVMVPGQTYSPRVTFRNTSPEAWPADAVFVSYHWFSLGRMLQGQYETPQTVVPFAVAAGQEATVDHVAIRPPTEPGSYQLQVTLLDRKSWFEQRGAATLMVPVSVFTPCGDAATGIVTSPSDPRTAESGLSPAGYKVSWTSVDIPSVMQSGTDQKGQIRFKNTSCEVWPLGVWASYHWYSSAQALSDPAPQTRIPFAIVPGQEVTVDNFLILPPAEPGSYKLEVTLVDRNAWFETKGAATTIVPVTVSPGRPAAAPPINARAARALTWALSIVLAIALAAAAVVYLMRRTDVALPLLNGAAITALLLATIPVLSALPRHLATQPFPDAQDYADGARHLANGDGYVTTVHGEKPVAPIWPPGFSLALAPFAFFGEFPGNVQSAVRWFAAVYLAVAAIAAWYLAGPLASVLTSVLLGISPFARIAATNVLSDLFAVILLVIIMMLIRRASPPRVFASGLLAGFLVSVRLSMGVGLPALALALPIRSWKTLALGVAPGLGALAIYQWLTFGSPIRSGYGAWMGDYVVFDVAYATAPAPRIGHGDVWLFPDRLNGQLMTWVCPCPPSGPQSALPNLWFYPVVLAGVFWVYTPPLVTLFGLAFALRHWREPPARFTLLLTVLMIGLHTFHYYQAVRFIAGPATLLGIYGALALAGAFQRRPITPVVRQN